MSLQGMNNVNGAQKFLTIKFKRGDFCIIMDETDNVQLAK